MNDSRLRAPFAILREVLGEPDDDHGMDKTSTAFVYVFEGCTVTVHDFHKEEWAETPECRTDSRYIWSIDSDDDVEPFCRWLSAEVIRRMRSGAGGRSLDHADRARLNALVASGLSLTEAMSQVAVVADDPTALYTWPLLDDPEPIATAAPRPAPTPAPNPSKPSAAQPVVRRRKRD